MRSRLPRSWPLDCAEWLAARRCRVRNSCGNARRPWRAAARLRCVAACGACCLAGVPGAVGPGRCVCWWVAARPRAVRATSFARRVGSKPGLAAVCAGGRCPTRVCCSWCRCCCGRRRARPPARSPHALLSLGVVDLEACPGPPDPTAPSIPVGLVSLIGGLVPCFEAWPGPAAVSEISHVIPLGLFQDLNCDRWNCNVCGRSPKVTVGNYVRLLFSSGPVAAYQHPGLALRALRHPSLRGRL